MLAAVGVAAAGCGGGGSRADDPRLAARGAGPLIALADEIARSLPRDGCVANRAGARLQARAIGLVNARRVPAALLEDLLGRINELVARPAPCLGSSARGEARQAQALAAWLRESSEN